MAKVMVSIPDDLLAEIDAAAKNRSMSRSALLSLSARRELERRDPAAIDAATARLREMFRASAPIDTTAFIRADRDRMPDRAHRPNDGS